MQFMCDSRDTVERVFSTKNAEQIRIFLLLLVDHYYFIYIYETLAESMSSFLVIEKK